MSGLEGARRRIRRLPDGPGDKIRHFMEILEKNFRTKHDVMYYARQLSLHPDSLSRLCRLHMGKPAKQVIAERIVEEARTLLRRQSAHEVGDLLGFHDASSFSRFFRRYSGTSIAHFLRSSSIIH